jgi:hypothetical protein
MAVQIQIGDVHIVMDGFLQTTYAIRMISYKKRIDTLYSFRIIIAILIIIIFCSIDNSMLLLINKPLHITSHDAISAVKKHLRRSDRDSLDESAKLTTIKPPKIKI